MPNARGGVLPLSARLITTTPTPVIGGLSVIVSGGSRRRPAAFLNHRRAAA